MRDRFVRIKIQVIFLQEALLAKLEGEGVPIMEMSTMVNEGVMEIRDKVINL